jgi:hypothetical protein
VGSLLPPEAPDPEALDLIVALWDSLADGGPSPGALRAVELALDPGGYAVTVERADGALGAADVRLPREGYTEVQEEDLVPVRLERVAARKGAEAERLPLTCLTGSPGPPLHLLMAGWCSWQRIIWRAS